MIPSTSLGAGRTQGVRIWLATSPVDMNSVRQVAHIRLAVLRWNLAA